MTQYLYELSIIVEDSYLCGFMLCFCCCLFVVLTYMNLCLHLCEISNKSSLFLHDVFITEFFSKFLSNSESLSLCYNIVPFSIVFYLLIPSFEIICVCAAQSSTYFLCKCQCAYFRIKAADKTQQRI